MNAISSEIATILSAEVAELTEEIASLLFNEPLEQQAFMVLLDKLQGVCRLLELDGAALVADELKRTLSFVVDQGSTPAAYHTEISQVLDTFPRVFAAINQLESVPPFLFTPQLALLRRLQGLPPLYEFQMVKGHRWPPAERFASSTALTPDLQPILKKLRQFYQMGLLEILRGRDQSQGAAMLARVTAKLRQIFPSSAEQRYWMLVTYVLDGLRDGRLYFNPVRVRLLAAVERQLKTLLDGGAEAAKAYPLGLWRAYGILLALMPAKSEAEDAMCNWVGVPRFDFTDEDLQNYRALIFGHDNEELGEVTRAMAERLTNLHNILELIDSHNQLSEEERSDLADLISEVATMCQNIGLQRAAERLRDHHAQMLAVTNDTWLHGGSLLREIAHSILYLECLLLLFRESAPLRADYLSKLDHRDVNSVVAEKLLHSSIHAVWTECVRKLATTKDALDQLDSDTASSDTQAVVLADLKEIEGAARLLGEPQVVDIVSRCRRFVAEKLFAQPESEGENTTTAFADTVAALEYYFHNTSRGDQSEFVLAIADDYLSALEAA